MDTGEFLTEAVLPDKETLDKFKDQPDPLLEAQADFEKIDAPPTPGMPLEDAQAGFEKIDEPPVLGMPLEDAQAGFEKIDTYGYDFDIPYTGPTDPTDLFPQTSTAEEELDAAGISFEPDELSTASLSEQEILDDPKTFTGPVGAGIGPETTDEDFQSQLSGILGEETPDAGAVAKRIIDQAQTNLADTGYNVGKGALEAFALSVEGGANSADFLVNRFKAAVDKDPSRFFRDATGKIVSDLNAGSDFFKGKISTKNYIRQLEALPAAGMTFGEAMPGGKQALDRAGRPYGTDKFATFLNAAEEFGDVATDIAVLALTGPLVGSTIVSAAGYL